MIKSWANRATEKFAEAGKGKFSGLDEDAALDMLVSLNAATSLADLSPLKSIGLQIESTASLAVALSHG